MNLILQTANCHLLNLFECVKYFTRLNILFLTVFIISLLFNEPIQAQAPCDGAPPIQLSYTRVDIGCSGSATGSIDLTVTGGTAPYTYDWDNDGWENPDNDPEDLANLIEGLYTVIVTDAKGCTATIGIDVSVFGIRLRFTKKDISCKQGTDGAIVLSASYGSWSYTYDWDNDGWETPDNDSPNLTGLGAGTYSIIVTDANGCTSTLSVTLFEPDELYLSYKIGRAHV